MVERRGLLDRRDIVRRPLGDPRVERGHEALLVVLGGQAGLPVERLAHRRELGRGVIRRAGMRRVPSAIVPAVGLAVPTSR